MKISCTPISYIYSLKSGKTQDDYFKLIKSAGADATDILEPNAYPWFWTDYASQIKTLKQRLSDIGLEISGYAAGNRFTEPDENEFNKQVNIVKKAINDTRELGAPCLRIFGGYHEKVGGNKGIKISNGLEYVKRGIEAVLPEAEKQGVVLALENHGRLPGLSTEILALIKYFNSPNLRVLFDVANFKVFNMDEHENPLDAYEVLKDYIVHCHVKGYKPAPDDTHLSNGVPMDCVPCVAGEGKLIPLRQFFYALAKNGYDKYCSLEYEGGEFTIGDKICEEEGVFKSIENLVDMRDSALLIKNNFKK